MAKKKITASQVVLTGLLIVTGLYLVCCVGLTLAQRRLIYYPCTVGAAEVQSRAAKRGFEQWTNSRGEFIGWYRGGVSSSAARTILLLHGNAGCASDWFHYSEGFQSAAAFEFYILEYPGYGGRKGSATQSSILAAADEAFAMIRQPCSIFLVGESLGSGPACYLAGKQEQVGGVFLVAPYDTMTGAAQSHLPLFPVRWMLRDKYPSKDWLKSFHGPLAVLLAEKDRVIPSKLGRKLFDGYAGPKKLWVEPGATHDDVHQPRAEIYKAVVRFWKEDSQ